MLPPAPRAGNPAPVGRARPTTTERVAVVPGSAFGVCGEGHVRACYASGYEQIERALERIGRFVQRNR